MFVTRGKSRITNILSTLSPLQKEALRIRDFSTNRILSPESQNESFATVSDNKNDEPAETKISEDQKLNNLIFLEQLSSDLTDFELQQKERKEKPSFFIGQMSFWSHWKTRKLITQIKENKEKKLPDRSVADSLQESPVKPFGYDFLRTNAQGNRVIG